MTKEEADIFEYDLEGNLIGWGSDRDYDSHALDIMNGNGYYDESGHYISFGRDE